MGKIKNQNKFHIADKTGKRTVCGLSNSFKEALTEMAYLNYYNNRYFKDVCCIKCLNSIK